MVICQERSANDLHMVRLMPLPPHHLCLGKIPNSTRYADIKGIAECRKWGGLGWLAVTQGH